MHKGELRVTLQEKAEALSRRGVFLGGPPGEKTFEKVGRSQLVILLKNGLYPNSRVLDVGCGALRGGYWLINFLQPGRYYGIEPNRKMLQIGVRNFLTKNLINVKRPRFAYNDDFDFTVFNAKFDFVIARSIWTHSARAHIQKMLDSFVKTKAQKGIFLTSYYPSGISRGYNWGQSAAANVHKIVETLRGKKREKGIGLASGVFGNYRGSSWVGRSHESDLPGFVRHSFQWICDECNGRGLAVREIKEETIGGQIWLRIE
jgi:SAM-dependent methyltransferase